MKYGTIIKNLKKSETLHSNQVQEYIKQLIGVKKGEEKLVESILPSNHPKKELANKKTKFECKILNIKKPEETIINDDFAKHMGAKDLSDLKTLIEKQVSSQYKQALDSITKKEISTLALTNNTSQLKRAINSLNIILKVLNKNTKKSNNTKKIIIAPNSSEITDTI